MHLRMAEKLTRAAAINTVRRWVPDVAPMDGMVREFAMRDENETGNVLDLLLSVVHRNESGLVEECNCQSERPAKVESNSVRTARECKLTFRSP